MHFFSSQINDHYGASMHILYIQRKIKFSIFVAWKWKAKDYKVPLNFPLDNARVYLYIEILDPGKRKRQQVSNGILQLQFSPIPAAMVRGLITSGKLSIQSAE
jgi:hypothetical protein